MEHNFNVQQKCCLNQQLLASARLVSSHWYAGPTIMTYRPMHLLHLFPLPLGKAHIRLLTIVCWITVFVSNTHVEHAVKYFLTEQLTETRGTAFILIKYFI